MLINPFQYPLQVSSESAPVVQRNSQNTPGAVELRATMWDLHESARISYCRDFWRTRSHYTYIHMQSGSWFLALLCRNYKWM